jgi:hypothetical protein
MYSFINLVSQKVETPPREFSVQSCSIMHGGAYIHIMIVMIVTHRARQKILVSDDVV